MKLLALHNEAELTRAHWQISLQLNTAMMGRSRL